MDTIKEQIARLKVGDKVALVSCFSSDNEPKYVGFLTVTGRTPKRIRCGEREYDLDGTQRGRHMVAKLFPYSEDARVAVAKLRAENALKTRHGELVRKFVGLGWSQVDGMPDEILEAMAKLLDEGLSVLKGNAIKVSE